MVQQGWMLPGAGTHAARGHGGGDVKNTGCLWLPTAGHPSPPSDIPAPTASLWVPTNPDTPWCVSPTDTQHRSKMLLHHPTK